MPQPASARLGLVAPSATDLVEQGDDILRAIVAQLEATAAIYAQGTAGARPAAGKIGRYYVATDTGVVSYDNGSAWVDVNPKGAAANVASMRTLGTGTGEAAPGTHAAQHARGAADAIPGLPPIGTIMAYAGSGDPTGGDWLLCDGRELARTGTYAALYAAIGTTYGAGNGSTTFNIPDLRGRVPVGADNMGTAQGAAGRLPNSNRSRGQSGGEEQHQLNTGEMPAHDHGPGTLSTGDANWSAGDWSSVYSAGGTAQFKVHTYNGNYVGGNTQNFDHIKHGHNVVNGRTGGAGGGGSHNNMQPYEVDNWIVRVL